LKIRGGSIRIIAITAILFSFVLLTGCLSQGKSNGDDTELYMNVGYDRVVNTPTTSIKLDSNSKNILINLNGSDINIKDGKSNYDLNLKDGLNEIVVTAKKELNGKITEVKENISIIYVKEGISYGEIFMGTIPIESGEFIFPKNGEILNESSLSLVTASGPSLKRNTIENPTDGTIDKNMYLTKVIATIETPGMTEDDEIELFVFVDNRVVDYTNHGLSIENDDGVLKNYNIKQIQLMMIIKLLLTTLSTYYHKGKMN